MLEREAKTSLFCCQQCDLAFIRELSFMLVKINKLRNACDVDSMPVGMGGVQGTLTSNVSCLAFVKTAGAEVSLIIPSVYELGMKMKPRKDYILHILLKQDIVSSIEKCSFYLKVMLKLGMVHEFWQKNSTNIAPLSLKDEISTFIFLILFL